MFASHDAPAENRGGRLFCNVRTSAATNAPEALFTAVEPGTNPDGSVLPPPVTYAADRSTSAASVSTEPSCPIRSCASPSSSMSNGTKLDALYTGTSGCSRAGVLSAASEPAPSHSAVVDPVTPRHSDVTIVSTRATCRNGLFDPAELSRIVGSSITGTR